MIIAAAVTVTELLMQAYSYELYQILGIFLPLITTNCIILGRADAFARKNAVPAALYDGFIMGVGFGAVLVLLGAIRELLGHRRAICRHAAPIWRGRGILALAGLQRGLPLFGSDPPARRVSGHRMSDCTQESDRYES